MKTTHELARELLALEDVPVVIEGGYGDELSIVVAEDDEGDKAFLCCKDSDEPPPDSKCYVLGRGKVYMAGLDENGRVSGPYGIVGDVP